jgi:Ca2+-binding RTX toxin-like protein
VIQSSNAEGGNFTFQIGGTITPPVGGPNFAVLNGTTLTITGTDQNDSIVTTINGSNFTATRNTITSNPFALSAVTRIIVNLLGGNDSYSSATQLDIKQTINGGAGNDLIRGGKQADVMNGGDGDDRMDGRTRGDVFNGEGGSDTAIYRQRRATEPVTVIIDEIANDGGSSDQSKDNVLSSTEHVQGGLGNDRLTGSSKTNRLFGFEGNDTIVGLKGNDTLDGGAGNNTIDGGFGNDQIFSRNSIADIVDGGADSDTLIGDLVDAISNVESPNLA